MSSFFSSLANKAQSAYEQSPISSQVSSLQNKLAHGSGPGQGNETAAAGQQGPQTTGLRGNIVHQFRNLQLQYASVDPVQRILTSQKGVSLDFESVSKDAKSQSKELYMWGQVTHGEDVQDVTDRLAYLNFVHGSLALELAHELNTSRTSFKTLRDAEKALEPRRTARINLETQIGQLEHDQKKKNEGKIAELRDQLEKLVKEDAKAEAEIHVIKRKAIAETERAKWAALREYGEKLVLLAESSAPIISALPQDLPNESRPYKGAEITAQTRATLQKTLDNYKPGTIGHAFQPNAEDMKRGDSRSFGVTHAAELSGIESPALPGHSSKPSDSLSAHNLPPPPAHPTTTLSGTTHQATPPSAFHPPGSSPPINPATLNNSPTPLPSKQPSTDNATAAGTVPIPAKVEAHPSTVSHSSGTMPSPEMGTVPIKVPEPSIAETGKPISAGAGGPGPASGSLKDLRSPETKPASTITSPLVPPFPTSGVAGGSSTATAPPPAATGTSAYPSAEEEKARLQREERERLAKESKHLTAEEEKKELEKQERERLMRESEQGGQGKGDEVPPAYQDNF